MARALSRSWLPAGRVARRSRGLLLGGVWLRCVTRWRARELDRQLAAGADPMRSDELSLRVGQLGSAGTRARLACGLREAVALATGRRAPLLATRLRLREIRRNDQLLLGLADRVTEDGPLGAQGLAMTAWLLDDRTSPLYDERRERSLAVTAFEALTALDRGLLTASARDRLRR